MDRKLIGHVLDSDDVLGADMHRLAENIPLDWKREIGAAGPVFGSEEA